MPKGTSQAFSPWQGVTTCPLLWFFRSHGWFESMLRLRMLYPDMGLKLITMHEPFGTWFNMIMEQPIRGWLMDNCWKEGGSGDRTWGLMLCMMMGIPLLGRVKWDTTFSVMKVPPNALNVVFSLVWPWNHVLSMSVPCHCRYYLKPLCSI
jgi:hypothetical protein